MVRLFRWLLRLFLVLAALVFLAGLILYYIGGRSLIDYSDEIEARGLNGPVEIIRNNAAVPHIFGESDEDTFFGLGFVHAQDRLWQMMMLRREAQGRMAELFGIGALGQDILMRRLDLYGAATRSAAVQDAPTSAALEAYSRGVNAWLREVNAGARGRGAPEFFLFTNAIAPWQPADSIAVMKLLAWKQSEQAAAEVLRARTSLILPPERVADIMPDMPGPGIAALSDYAQLLPRDLLPDGRSEFAAVGAAKPYSVLAAAPAPSFTATALPQGGASNAWAAAPSRSAAGGTLLASDPHMGYTAPSIWYLARLELATGGVIGATIPGLPLILHGRSDDFGWGLTAAFIDDQDLFVEELDPSNPARVRGPDGWDEMRRRATILEVKDASPVTIELQWTANGPVLPPEALGVGLVTPRGHVMSLGWTGLSDEDTTLSAAMALMRANSLAAAAEAGASWIAPGMNVVMADKTDVGLQSFGAIPSRDAAHQSRGRMPSPGWIETNRWQGMLPYSANPSFLRPSGGIVGNTNNKVVARPFPNHASYHWGDSQRIGRWQRLMQNREVHTRESFIEAQLDTVSPAARALLPLVGADLWFTGEAAPEGSRERLRQRALALVADWNGEMNEHMPEPLIYAAWMRALQERLIRDELGALAQDFTELQPLFIERVFRNEGGASVWCDILRSAPVETCTDIARMALDDALVWITDRYGNDPASWRWGDAHEAVQDHPTLGKMTLIRYVANIRQSTSGGDSTLNMGRLAAEGRDPFRNVAGPGYRGVYDFADPDSSVFIISTGQSGHPLSRHYDDLGVLWRRGEYLPMSLDPELARAGAAGITRLTPLPADETAAQ